MRAPVTVRDYLRLLFRRKYAIAVPIFCSVFLILPAWKIVPEKYRATALVKRKDLALTNAAAGSLMVHDNGPVPVETMRAEILTWTNLDRVIKQLKLDVDLKTPADWQNEYETAQEFHHDQDGRAGTRGGPDRDRRDGQGPVQLAKDRQRDRRQLRRGKPAELPRRHPASH